MSKVQLVFNLQGPQENVEPIVKRVTKGHEILDVNGFTLKRRKVQNAENILGNEAKTPHVQQPGSGALQSPYVDEYDVDEELYYRLTRDLQALPDNAQPAERLTTICNSVCEAEAVKADGDVCGALKDVFTTFITSVREATASGAIQIADSNLENGGATNADLHVDLEARKAGLRARIAKFQQEESEWKVLMSKVNELDDVQAEVEAAEEETNGEPAIDAASEELVALRRLKKDVHRRLALQVDGVCLLVGDVEELVAKANKSAQVMQAEYHQEKFKTFQHVNSPARLIKAILSKKPAAPAN